MIFIQQKKEHNWFAKEFRYYKQNEASWRFQKKCGLTSYRNKNRTDLDIRVDRYLFTEEIVGGEEALQPLPVNHHGRPETGGDSALSALFTEDYLLRYYGGGGSLTSRVAATTGLCITIHYSFSSGLLKDENITRTTGPIPMKMVFEPKPIYVHNWQSRRPVSAISHATTMLWGIPHLRKFLQLHHSPHHHE